MSEHTYSYGQLVERISTRERAQYAHGPIFDHPPQLICGVSSVADKGKAVVFWPASDCRPAVDHAAELAAKDAEIAKLKAFVDNICGLIGFDGERTEFDAILDRVRIQKKDAAKLWLAEKKYEQRIAELEAQVSAEKDAYHKLANEAQEKYTKLYATERENAKLRKLCGEAAKFFINTECGHFECHKCKHLHNCGLVEGEMTRKLRAAAEGGE